MRHGRDRSAVLGEAATVVELVFGFSLGGELAADAVRWLVEPAAGALAEFGPPVASALGTSLAWSGVAAAAAYASFRVSRYGGTTPDPGERTRADRDATVD